MKCERCGADTSVKRYEVDGFAGYLCDDCRTEWKQLTDDD